MSKQTRANDTQDQKHSTRRKVEQAPGAQTAPSTQTAPAGGRLQRLPDKPGAATPSDVVQTQTRSGNRAVQRLLSTHTVQAKLEVGPANDHYEQEADHVAQQVMRMPAEGGKDDEEENKA